MSEQADLGEFTTGENKRSNSPETTAQVSFPDNWNVVDFRNIIEDSRYGTDEKSNTEGNGYPTLRIPNVVNKYITTEDIKYSPVSDKEAKRLQLEKGDILIVRTNGNPDYVGRCAVVGDETEGYIFASYLIRLRINKEAVDPQYVADFLNSTYGRKEMSGWTPSSAGNHNLSIGSLENFSIPIPPRPSQSKIVQVLDDAKKSIQNTKELIEQVGKTKKGVLQDLFDKSGFRDEEFVSIADLGEWSSGSTPSKKNEEYWNGEICWLSPKDIFQQETNRITDTESHISEQGKEKTTVYPSGSIAVVVRSGVLDRTLPVAKIEVPAAVNQDIKILEQSDAIPDYLLYAFEAYSNQIRQRSQKQGTTWVDSIQMMPFMRFEMPVPDKERQNEIISRLRPFDKILNNQRRYLRQLERTKQGLEQDLLSGEVRTTDTNIEVLDEVAQHG